MRLFPDLGFPGDTGIKAHVISGSQKPSIGFDLLSR